MTLLRLTIVEIFACALLVIPVTGQAPESARVEDYLRREMERQQIPGIAVAVIRDGSVILAQGYGFANLDHMVPVTPETIFQSGSVGKVFTVFGVMLLVDDGALHLDDPLAMFVPDAPPGWGAITVRHLLEHTSGLPGYPPEFDFRVDRTEDELYEMIKTQPLAFAPGASRAYSNLGFVMLGIVIRKVTGQFYGDFLAERIFTPLGMASARVISEADIVPRRAEGYRLEDGHLRRQQWVAPSLNTTADGALYLSVLDLAKWEAALNARQLLSASGYEAMWSPVITNDGVSQPWALSWQVEDLNGHQVIEHSGGWQGFTANFSRYPAQRLTVVVMTNLRAADPVELTRGIQFIYQPELSIADAPPLPDTEPAVRRMVMEVLRRVASGQLRADMFVAPAGDDWLTHADMAAAEFVSLGPLTQLDLINRREASLGSRVYHYRASHANGQRVLQIGLDGDDRITSLQLRRP